MKTRKFIEHIIINGAPSSGTKEYFIGRKNNFLNNNIELKNYIQEVIELLKTNDDCLLDCFKLFLSNEVCGSRNIRTYLNFFVDEYNYEYEPIDTINHINTLLKVYKEMFTNYELNFLKNDKEYVQIGKEYKKHYMFYTPLYTNEFGDYSIDLDIYEEGVRSIEVSISTSNRIIKQAFELFENSKDYSITKEFKNKAISLLLENEYIYKINEKHRLYNFYHEYYLFNDEKLDNYKTMSFSLIKEEFKDIHLSEEAILKL